MSKINFTNTLYTASNSQECFDGIYLYIDIIPSAGNNSVFFTKETSDGIFTVVTAEIDSVVNGTLSQFRFSDTGTNKSLSFNFTPENTDALVTVKILATLARTRYGVLKVSLGSVDSSTLDYITIDCLAPATEPTPTPTSTHTPTPTRFALFGDIDVFDLDDSLQIGDILYSSSTGQKYSFAALVAANPFYSGSEILYIRKPQENVVYKVQRHNDDDAIIIDFALCPSQTPTPTQTSTPGPTPSNTQTQTKTPTNTASVTTTPTKTPTPTISPTRSQTPTVTPTHTSTPTPTDTPTIEGYNYYYVATNINNLCYAKSSLLPTILIYDNIIDNTSFLATASRLSKKEIPQQPSDYFKFNELKNIAGSDTDAIYIRRITDTSNRIISIGKSLNEDYAIILLSNLADPLCVTPTASVTQSLSTTPSNTPTLSPTRTSTQTPTPSPYLDRYVFTILKQPQDVYFYKYDRNKFINAFTQNGVSTQSGILSIGEEIFASLNNDFSTTDLSSAYTLNDLRNVLQDNEVQKIYLYGIDTNKLYELINVNDKLVVNRELVIPTPTPTSSQTRTPTATPTNTQTNTSTPALTPLPTETPTNTPSVSPSFTPTNTPTNSTTPTNTSSPGTTPTTTPTQSQTPTSSMTGTPAVTPTPTHTVTPQVLSKAILIQLDRLTVGKNYLVEFFDSLNDPSEVTFLPQQQTITATSAAQNVGVRIIFSGSIRMINVTIKVTDIINNYVDYNNIIIYCHDIQECY